MKKFLCFILMIVLITVSGTTAFASEISKNDNPIFAESEYALLTNENGEIYYVRIDNAETTLCTTTLQNGDVAVTKNVLINGDNIIPASATQSNYREDWDSTLSIRAYTTIYFKESGSPSTYLVTKVTGGFVYDDLDVNVTNQRVVMGCTGPLPSYTYQKKIENPNSTSFSYNTGFTDYVLPDGAEIGASYTLTIVRNGNPWTLVLINSLTSEDDWTIG